MTRLYHFKKFAFSKEIPLQKSNFLKNSTDVIFSFWSEKKSLNVPQNDQNLGTPPPGVKVKVEGRPLYIPP